MLIILTAASLLLAVIMSVVAWRASSEERRRSDARIAVLAQEIHAPALGDLPLRPVAVPTARDAMFAAAARPAPSRPQWGLAIATGAFVVATVAAAAIVFSGESPSAATAASTTAVQAPMAPPAEAVPLELVALGHDRGDDRLTIRGVVRNPAAGMEMDRLTAVVFVFDRDGGFVTSGRAAVESPALAPGSESAFTVAIPIAGDVGRYRVSFRSDERVVSHIDKRSGS